jgi:hypothetical protein
LFRSVSTVGCAQARYRSLASVAYQAFHSTFCFAESFVLFVLFFMWFFSSLESIRVGWNVAGCVGDRE